MSTDEEWNIDVSGAVAAACGAALLIGGLTACGSGHSEATCDDYAKHDMVARTLLVTDAMRRHDVNVADVRLHRKIDAAISAHCGDQLDPKGNVQATRHHTDPFDGGVDWPALTMASVVPVPPSPNP